ncbi:MAG: MFS transporter [Pseudomonadota bacterium]
MLNVLVLTLIAFLAYSVTAALLMPAPILVAPVGGALSLSAAEAARALGAVNLGILAGAIAAVWLLLKLQTRLVLLLSFVAVAAAVLAIVLLPTVGVVRGALFIAGFACGIGLPAAANIIASTHAGERRASMLVVTDGAFSVSGFAAIAVGGWLLAAGNAWPSVYGLAGCASLAALALIPCTNFRDISPPPGHASPANWPVAVWWCALALTSFTLGQFSLVLWLPTYLETAHDVAAIASAKPVSAYFVALFAGQLLAAVVVLPLGLLRLLPIAVVLCAGLGLGLSFVTGLTSAQWLAVAWGVGTLGLLKLIVTLGSQLADEQQVAVISTLLLAATVGTALAPYASSLAVDWFSVRAALWFAGGALVLSVLGVFAAMAHRTRTVAC